MGHPLIMAVAIAVELGEHQVPELHITVAIASGRTIGLSASIFLAAIIIDLRTRAAGARTDLPEVVIAAHPDNSAGIHSHLIDPNLFRLIIIFEDGNPKAVHWQFNYLGDKFPSPSGSLMLEIIPKRKVPQHLEIGAMAGCLTYIFDIRSTDTLLAGTYPLAGRGFNPQEPLLHRRHARIDQQKAGLIRRGHQRKARQPQMPLRFKKAQELLPQFVESGPFHVFLPLL